MNPASTPPAKKTARPLTENRRRANRHRLSIPATLVAEGEHPTPIEVTITEMSIGGVGFTAKAELKQDAAYHLNSFDTLIPPGMKLRIVSQRKLPAGGFEIGAKVLQ
jgi:hypothetical protein